MIDNRIISNSEFLAENMEQFTSLPQFAPDLGDDLPDYDEDAYLQLNPDVAEAVMRGAFPCGYDHFIQHGRQEGRPSTRRETVLPNRFLFTSDFKVTSEPVAPQLTLEAFIQSEHGIFLNGWAADAQNRITQILLSGRGWSFLVKPSLLARVRRTDVEAVITKSDPYSYGFWTFIASDRAIPDGGCTVEVSFENGATASQVMEASRTSNGNLRNIAMEYLYHTRYFDAGHATTIASINTGIGEHVIRFNRHIARQLKATVHVERFHSARTTPKATIIVCLYGKPEFLFLQSCLFYKLAGIEDYEFIYVSNSTGISERLLNEARISSRVYGIDLTCALLAGNGGFGAANNVAASLARSNRILIMNPDVFPYDPEWALKHLSVVNSAPTEQTRLFGAPLYYDDGSLMHGGMYFDIDRALITEPDSIKAIRLARVEHFGKGSPPEKTLFTRPRQVPAVSGAFMSLDRSWYERLGGFSEEFVFGHYEDADLCLRSTAAGTPPWLHDVRLWHLEGNGGTRHAMHEGGSLVNRWLFSRNWADRIESDYLLGYENVRAIMQHDIPVEKARSQKILSM